MATRIQLNVDGIVKMARDCGLKEAGAEKFKHMLEAADATPDKGFDLWASKINKLALVAREGLPNMTDSEVVVAVGRAMERALDFYYRLKSGDFMSIGSEIRISAWSEKHAKDFDRLAKLLDKIQGGPGHKGIAEFPELHAALRVAALLACPRADCGLRECWETRHWCDDYDERMSNQQDTQTTEN